MNLPENKWIMQRANNYVSSSDREQINGVEKPAGSVIFPKVGATIHTNKKRLLAHPAFVDNNVMAVWPIDPRQCSPAFLYAHFLTVNLSDLSNPGPLPSINNGKIHELQLALPPKPEQEKIAAVLWKLQHAIEVEEALLTGTRELKQSTMRHLFTHGLHGEPPKETPFGQVPKAWEIKPLSDWAFVQTGATKGRKINTEDAIEVPYLRVANVQDGHLNLKEMKTITIRRDELPGYQLQNHDVVLTEGGDFDKLGRGFIWENQINPCIHQNHVFAVRVNREKLSARYFAYLAQSPYGKAYFLMVAHKTTNLACINTTKLRAFPVVRPELDEQREIASILQTIDRKISVHERKRTALQDLFQTMLHHLMTAQIRVDTLEIDTSEVVK